MVRRIAGLANRRFDAMFRRFNGPGSFPGRAASQRPGVEQPEPAVFRRPSTAVAALTMRGVS